MPRITQIFTNLLQSAIRGDSCNSWQKYFIETKTNHRDQLSLIIFVLNLLLI